MSIPEISESEIRYNSSTSSFTRGEEYYKRGAVSNLHKRGSSIQAEVEGSDITPYRVSIRFDTGEITSARCTCPYDYGGWCKHIVATLLTCSRQPRVIEERPTLEQLLDRLDYVQTQRLIQELVAEAPELIDVIDRYVSLMVSPSPSKPSSKQKRQTIDVAPFRQQVKQILRNGLRELEYGYEEDPFSDDLLAVIEKAQDLAKNGDGNSAIAILEAITAAYAEEWEELLDYGGDVYSITDYLDEVWTEAILCAEILEPEAVDLQVMLEAWQDELDTDFTMSMAALRQGWEDENLQRILAGDRSVSLWADMPPDFAEDLALIRLQILERQQRYIEYLNLARAEGLMQQYLTRLVAVGQVEEAMAAAKTHMSTAETAFALAKALREREHLSEALAIAQTGLTLSGHCLYDLAAWTSDLAQSLSNFSAAVNASIVAFNTRPSFRYYRKVEELVGDSWSTVKQDLLKTLRAYRDWGAEQAKVDIFLYEGLVDDAIAVVSSPYSSPELVMRVMETAIPHRPDWVIDNARSRAEPIINQGKADRYDEAVKWLQKVKAAYFQLGQQSQWSDYRSQLTTTHGRKRKLMELFKQLV